MIVSNATPILHLARAGLLYLLPRLYDQVTVPASVWEEILGRGEPRPETQVLQDASEKWLKVRTLAPGQKRMSEALRRGAPVGQGEADTIALAEALTAPVLMDDRVAVDLARMRGIETHWTTSVVLEAHQRGILDRTAARRAVEDLVSSGLWIRQDVLLRILAILAEG